MVIEEIYHYMFTCLEGYIQIIRKYVSDAHGL